MMLHRLVATQSVARNNNYALMAVRHLGKGKDQSAKKTATKAASTGAAAESKVEGHVALPVQLYGVNARYANALYVAATKAGTLNAVESDLNTIQSWLKSNPAFSKYLNNPIIRKNEKLADVEKISKGMNETTRGFLAVLASNGRLADLEKVMSTFGILMNARSGTVEATVTTAEPLAGDALKKIEKNILNSYLEKGQSLKLTTKVDPSILGGLQVKIGERFIDLSVSSKISKYEKLLSAAV